MAGPGHRLDLVFDTTLPSGQRMRYQVLRIAVPRKGRALPLLQLAYDRDHLSPDKSQNQIEQDALLAVLGALPKILSENFSVNLEQGRISPRMGVPIVTVLEGDAPYERGYHNE
jgi:hypothetical protein